MCVCWMRLSCVLQMAETIKSIMCSFTTIKKSNQISTVMEKKTDSDSGGCARMTSAGGNAVIGARVSDSGGADISVWRCR